MHFFTTGCDKCLKNSAEKRAVIHNYFGTINIYLTWGAKIDIPPFSMRTLVYRRVYWQSVTSVVYPPLHSEFSAHHVFDQRWHLFADRNGIFKATGQTKYSFIF